MSGEGEMVGGACWLPGVLLVESPSGYRIALPVQNDPPGAGGFTTKACPQ